MSKNENRKVLSEKEIMKIFRDAVEKDPNIAKALATLENIGLIDQDDEQYDIYLSRLKEAFPELPHKDILGYHNYLVRIAPIPKSGAIIVSSVPLPSASYQKDGMIKGGDGTSHSYPKEGAE